MSESASGMAPKAESTIQHRPVTTKAWCQFRTAGRMRHIISRAAAMPATPMPIMKPMTAVVSARSMASASGTSMKPAVIKTRVPR